MASSLGLKIQRLPSRGLQVLVLTGVAVARSESGWATPRSVTTLFESLRIESPKVSEYLTRLRRDGLVLPRTGGGEWSLQPEGREAVREALADLDYGQIEAELRSASGAQYLSTLNPVIDPAMTPPRWGAGVVRLHERFPFDTNVFCMTRSRTPVSRNFPIRSGRRLRFCARLPRTTG
jgi:hypothetical protein